MEQLNSFREKNLFSKKIKAAVKDAKAADYDPKSAVGGVFCTFKMAQGGEWDKKRQEQITTLRKWVRQMKVADTEVDVLAACFPKVARNFVDIERGSKELWYWPGVILALKTAE